MGRGYFAWPVPMPVCRWRNCGLANDRGGEVGGDRTIRGQVDGAVVAAERIASFPGDLTAALVVCGRQRDIGAVVEGPGARAAAGLAGEIAGHPARRGGGV